MKLKVKQSFLALLVSLIAVGVSSIVTFKMLGLFLVLVAVGIVILNITSNRLVFITGCVLPVVYIPLALTGGIYMSFTYFVLFLSILIYLKYYQEMPKIGKLEGTLIILGVLIAIRLLLIGVLIEKFSFSSTFGVLAGDLAKIVSGIIFMRLAQIKRLRSDIFTGLIFAVVIMVCMHVYQMLIGLNNLLGQGYTTPYFNYNTASGKMRPFSTFLTPVTYGAYLASLCGFLFWYIPKQNSTLKWIVLLIGLFALIGTGTRSAWIAFALGMILVTLFQKSINWGKVIVIGSPLVGLLLLAILLRPELFDPFTGRLSTVTDLNFSSNATRLKLWGATLHAITDGNWLIGYGQKDFIEIISNYVPYNIAILAHPHQTFLEIFFRFGLIGLIPYIAIFIITFSKAVRGIKHSENPHASSAALAAVLIFVISSCFETLWGSFNVYSTLFLLMGFAFSPDDKKLKISMKFQKKLVR